MTFIGDKTAVLSITPSEIVTVAADSHMFRYEGSLTTPNCDGVVQWLVYKQPVVLKYETVSLIAFRLIHIFPSFSLGPLNIRIGM